MIDWDTFKAQLQTNPGKVLKSVLLLAGSFLLIWLLVVVQSDSPGQNTVNVQASGRLDSLQLRSAVQPSDSLVVSKTQPQRQSFSTRESDFNVFGLLPKVLIFLIAIGAVWFWLRSKKPSGSAKVNGTVFTTIGSQQLPGGQYLTVTKLNGEYWVMATGGTDGVSLLHRYSAEEWNGLQESPKQNDWKETFMTTLKQTASQPKKTG